MLGFSGNNKNVSGFRVAEGHRSEWFLAKQKMTFLRRFGSKLLYTTRQSVLMSIFSEIFSAINYVTTCSSHFVM